MSTPEKSRRWIECDEAMVLWQRYRRTGDQRLRDRLVLTYAPLVKYIVFRKIRELPASCELEDFVSAGLEALMRSIDRFDPAKGATLEQFAWTRIHGAVLDELRRADWAPRSLRRWERESARATTDFTALHGRRPTQEELADSLGTTVDELRRRQDEVAAADVTSLNTLVLGGDDTEVERIDTLASDDLRADPEHETASGQAKDRFRRAFDRLPRRQREVAILLYVKHLTLKEVGEVLGVSESRVCQIHGELKRTLRRQLAAEESLFMEVA